MQYKRWIAAVLTAVMLITGVGATDAAAADETEGTAPLTFTVTDAQYGAVDGEESTAAFQKALDDAAAVATDEAPATVIVPAGTYYMNSTLIVNSNITLKCAPQAVIKKLDTGFGYMLRSAQNGRGGFDNVRNITIEGGTWDAMYYRAQEDTGGSHMYIVHGENITFRGVIFLNNYGAHMIEVGGVRNLLVEDCTFDGFEMYKAADAEDGTEKEAVQVDVVHSTKMMPSAEPYDDTPCVDVIVRNNRFYNCSRGFGTHSAVKGVYIENVLVENNHFENLTDQAVYTYRFLNLTVRNNTVKNAACGVVFKTRHSTGTSGWYEPLEGVQTKTVNDYKVLIENNNITTTNESVLTRMQQYGIWVYGIEEDKFSGCTIRNNTVNSASCGVYANFANDVTVKGNVIKRTNATTSSSFSADGIKAKSSAQIKIQNNSLLPNAGNRFESGIAIRTDCTAATISNNRISSNTATDHGILVATASSATVSGNTVSGIGGNGVYINACNTANSITSNTVSGAGKNGILLNYSKASNISGNTVSGAEKNGILLNYGTASKVDGNTVSGSKSHGVDLTLSTVTTLDGNRIASNGGSGVSLTDSTADTVNKNTVEQNSAYGIKLDKSTAKTITANTVRKNAKSGIFFNNFSNLSNLYGNTVSQNGYSGIDFENWSAGASVYNNTLSANKKDGITLQSGAQMTSIHSNKITDSGRHGVSAYQAATVTYLKSNTVTGSKTNGISLDAATIDEITSNTINGSKNNGIYLTMRADATVISSNKLSKNKQGIWVQQNSTVKSIQNNIVSATKSNGIFVGTGSAATTVSKNKVTSSGAYGVYLRTGTVTELTSNTISDGKGYGLYVNASTASKVTGNKLSENKGAMYFVGAKVKSIKKNTLTDNGAIAVKVSATSKSVKPTELTIKRIKKGAKKITGQTAAKVKITVKLQGKTYKKTSDKKGKFSIKVKKCKKNKIARFSLTYGGNTVVQNIKVG